MKFLDLFKRQASPFTASRAPLAAALEPRMLFDGAIAATVVETADTAEHTTTADAKPTDDSSQQASDAVPPAATSDQRQEVVFIDGNVDNKQQLIAGLKPGTEVVVLDSAKDGLQQIADYLNGRSGIDAIHLISHGEAGKVQLGSDWLDSNALDARSETLASIGKALSTDGDILLYGCDVGANGAGQDFIQNLAAKTGADVAASSNDTGNAARGGDWVLERSTGSIEQSTVWNALPTDYAGLLANGTLTFSNNTGLSGGVAQDGQGGSSNLSGITLEIFNISDVNGTKDIRPGSEITWHGNDYFYSLDPNYTALTNESNDGSKGMAIKSSDGSPFQINGFTYYNWGETENSTNTVKGYLNGVEVASQDFTVVYDKDRQISDIMTVSLGSGFDRVDEVRMYISAGGYLGDQSATHHSINNILIADAVTPAPSAPTLTATGNQPTFTENGAAVGLFSGANAATQDSGQTFTSMTLVVANVGNGAQEILTIGGIDIALSSGNNGVLAGGGNYSVTVTSGFASVFLSGMSQSDAQMGALVESISYRNTSDNPSNGYRVFSIINIADSGSSNNVASVDISSTVSVVPVNDAPITETSGGTTDFTEGNNVTSTPVAVDPNITVSDVDSPTLSSAQVQIIGNYHSAEDSLGFVSNPMTMGDISGLYNSSTGVLSLTSASGATTAQWEAALRSVIYTNNSDAPSTATRTISFTVNDGNSTSDAATKTVSVTAVNDSPTLANPIADVQVTQGANLSFQFASNTFNDVDDIGTLKYTAYMAGGSALPSWLTFNPLTRTFSGTADNAVVGSLSIVVTASDNLGALVTDNFTITVNSPNVVVTDVHAMTLNGTYKVGETITIAVQFSESVVVTGGNPTLLLETGAVDRFATYLSGSGTSELLFTYTVQAGDLSADLNYQSSSALSLNGATLTNLSSNNATLDLPTPGGAGSLGGNESIVVDGVAPTVLSGTVPADGLYTPGQNLDFVLSLSEAVVVDSVNAKPYLEIDVGGQIRQAEYVSGSGTTALLFRYTVQAGDNDGNGITLSNGVKFTGNSIHDVAGNSLNPAFIASATPGIQIDAVAPEVTAISLDGQGQGSPGTLTYTVTFSENVSGVDLGDFSLLTTGSASGTLRSMTQISPNMYRITVDMISGQGNLRLDLNAHGSGIVDVHNNALTESFSTPEYAVNDAPTLTNPIANQNATQGTSFNFTLPANTFHDANAGGTLTYTAQLTGGGALPAWLSFNAATCTFSGTPANGDVGNLTIEVTASNGNGGTVTDAFEITVANTNDAPTVANPIANQQASQGSSFSFQFAGNTFNDIDANDTLTYTAQLVGGGALPAWLTFDPVSRTFSGTPANGDVGTLAIELTAHDGNGGTVTDAFEITVANTNDAPTVANPIANQQASQGSNFSFQFAGNTFTDIDANDTLTYTAQLVGGGALPAWLSFDPVTRTFSGTPGNGDVGTLAIELTASDGNGGTVTDAFEITVANTNDAPTVANPIANQQASQGSSFNFQFAGNTFTDIDANDTLTYTAQLAGGGALPVWLSFDPVTRTFSGTPGSGHAGVLNIDIIASDSKGATATDGFTITVQASKAVVTDVSAVGPNGNGAYKVGDTITVSMTFDHSVYVSGGSPTLLLETGAIDRTATYISGSGTNTLLFTYTVQAGDLSTDLDYNASTALALNGATIADAHSNNAVLTLPTPGGAGSLGGNESIVVDGVAPTVLSGTVPADGFYTAGDHLDFVLNLSEAVIVDSANGTPYLEIDVGGQIRQAEFVSGSGTNMLTFRYTVQAGDNDGNGITLSSGVKFTGNSIRDVAGNTLNPAFIAGATPGIQVDTVAPEVTSISLDGPGAGSPGSLTFTVTFSENVNGVTLGDFNLLTTGSASGTLSSMTQISPNTYRITVDMISGQGNLGLALDATNSGVVDSQGNALALSFSTPGYAVGTPTVPTTPAPAPPLAPSGDPQRMANAQVSAPTPVTLPQPPSEPGVGASDVTSPLLPAPLFEIRTLGSDIPTLGNIFISNGALAPSFIAQVFASSDGSDHGSGFPGFGGSDGGIFGSSSLASIYSRPELPESGSRQIWGGNSGSDISQGLRGVFGAPSLSQQLHDIHHSDPQQLRELALALGQITEPVAQA